MNSSRNTTLGLAALALLGLSAAHPAAAQTPIAAFTGGTSRQDFANATVGFRFTANSSETVTALGYYDTGTLLENHQVGIFDNTTQSLLGTVTITAGSAPTVGSFSYLALTTPVTLTTGSDYVLVGYTGASNTDPFIDMATTSTSPTGDTFVRSTYNAGGGFLFPSNQSAYQGGFFGPNALVGSPSPAPEPAQLATLSMVVLGLGGLMLKARRRSAAAPKVE